MSEFKFSCSQCGQHLAADDSWIGQSIQCPSCQATLVVPRPAAPPPVPKISVTPSLPPVIPKTPATFAAAQTAAPTGNKGGGQKVWIIVGIAIACLAVAVVIAGVWIFGFYFKTSRFSQTFPGNSQQPI